MTLVNLTPHAVTLYGVDGVRTLPPSGVVARVACSRLDRGYINLDGVRVEVSSPVMGEVAGLPTPSEGVGYIVSALVATKAARADVFSPGELVRDPSGAVVGARGLCSYV